MRDTPRPSASAFAALPATIFPPRLPLQVVFFVLSYIRNVKAEARLVRRVWGVVLRLRDHVAGM